MTESIPLQVLWKGFWKLNLMLLPLSLLLFAFLGIMGGGSPTATSAVEAFLVAGAFIYLGPAILVALNVAAGKVADAALRIVPLKRPAVTWLGILIAAVLVVVAANVFIDDLSQFRNGNYGLSILAVLLDFGGMVLVVSAGGGKLPAFKR
jgi:hypothetical protein